MPEEDIKEKLVDVADVMSVIVVGALLIFTAFAFLVHNSTGKKELANNDQAQSDSSGVTIPSKPINPFDEFSIEAKAAVVYDIKNDKVVFEKNPDKALPLASLTKIMTGLTAVDTLPTNTKVVINQDAVNEEGDSGLSVGESWSLKNLLDFTLMVSSNDGASALAAASTAFTQENNFVHQMNQKAKDIGLTTMHFNNETGLDVDQSTAGGYGSAKDVAHLVEYALRNDPTLLEATRYPKTTVVSDTATHFAQNTDTLVTQIPGMLASKTGYSELAGGNLVIAFDAGLGEQYVAVVLGSSYDGRFTDVKKLVQATQKTLTLSTSYPSSHE